MKWIAGCLGVLGLCLVMSDGPWFPIHNLVGLLILALGTVLAWLSEKPN